MADRWLFFLTGEMMIDFYPDKPMTADPSHLVNWELTHEYFCQQKLDGWRCLAVKEEKKIKYFSRHGKNLTAEIDPFLREEVKRLLEPFSDIVLDGEWLARRSCSVQYSLLERLVFFDLLRMRGNWWFNKSYQDRWFQLKVLWFGNNFRRIDYSETVEKDFLSFFEAQKKIPYSEGVVVKHKNSLWKAGRKGSVDNPLWFKCRWRGGVSGEADLSATQAIKGR